MPTSIYNLVLIHNPPKPFPQQTGLINLPQLCCSRDGEGLLILDQTRYASHPKTKHRTADIIIGIGICYKRVSHSEPPLLSCVISNHNSSSNITMHKLSQFLVVACLPNKQHTFYNCTGTFFIQMCLHMLYVTTLRTNHSTFVFVALIISI